MLASAADERTLLDDWIARRQRLSASETMPEQHRRMQLQVDAMWAIAHRE